MNLLLWLATAIFFGILGFYVLCFLMVALVWLGMIAVNLMDFLGKAGDAFTDTVLNTMSWIVQYWERYLKANKSNRHR